MTDPIEMREKILEVRELKKYFYNAKRKKSIRAVEDIGFDLYKNETLGIVGESGCGKSTMIRLINHLHTPTSGSVIFQGTDLTKLSKNELIARRKDMQMVFQDPYGSLNPSMTINEILAEPLQIYSKLKILNLSPSEINEKIDVMLEKVGLIQSMKNRYPHEFSGGQKQRIAIARALILDPKLVLLDEPVSALDVSIQAQILNLLVKLQEESDLTYLFIAHDLSVVEYISDRVIVMYLGNIVEIADATTLYKSPQHPYTKALLSSIPIANPKLERSRKREILSGELPSPYAEIQGCPFYNRCPVKMDICQTKKPVLKTVEGEHQTACFRVHPLDT